MLVCQGLIMMLSKIDQLIDRTRCVDFCPVMKSAARYPKEIGQGKPEAGVATVEASLWSSLIHVEYRDSRYETKFHRQPGIELHLTMAGQALFHVSGRNYLQTPGGGMVLRGSNPHQLQADRSFPFQRTVVCFDPKDFGVTARGESLLALDWVPESGAFPFALSETDFARADELARWLNREVNLRLQGWRDSTLGIVLGLLALVRRNGVGGGVGRRNARRGQREHRSSLVGQVALHVRNNLSEPLMLAGTAALFDVTPEHLTRSFRRQLGVSFHRYVLSERVAAAKKRLRDQSEVSVTEIAFATGFESSSHFCKVFKKQTLLSPSQFRKGAD